MKDIDIRRGDIYWIQGDGMSMGSEIHDSRPGVVISSDHGNRSSNNVIVVYMTTAEKRPMVIHADVMGTVPATAMCEQVYTVSKERLGRYQRTCTEAEMQAIDRALGYSIGLVGAASEPVGDDERVKELEAKIAEMETALKDAEESFEAMREDNEKLRKEKQKVIEFSCNNLDSYAEKIRMETELGVYKGLFERWFAERV